MLAFEPEKKSVSNRSQSPYVIPTHLDSSLTQLLIQFLQVPQGQQEVTEDVEGISGGTTIGQVRKENQDRYLIGRFNHPDLFRSFVVAAVADGVGSLPSSGLSASSAIASFVSSLVSLVGKQTFEFRKEGWTRLLLDSVQYANRFTYDLTNERGATTLSAVIVPDNSPAVGIQVGDSKIFGISPQFEFTQLSVDQTVGSHLAALGLPQANVAGRDARFDRSLAQFIGMPDSLLPQIVEFDGKWSSILIASDGVASVKKLLAEEGWNRIYKAAKSPADFVRKVLYLTNWLGGEDNSTIVIFPPMNESFPGIFNSRVGSLSVTTGTRSLELMTVAASSLYNNGENNNSPDRRRNKASKDRKNTKVKPTDLVKNIEDDQKQKTPPSITFLPGLSKE